MRRPGEATGQMPGGDRAAGDRLVHDIALGAGRVSGCGGESLRHRVADLCEGYSARELDLIADFMHRCAGVVALCREEAAGRRVMPPAA